MKCPVCDTPNPEHASFCLNCGIAFDIKPALACPRCGIGLPAHAKFCFACGASVGTSVLAKVPERSSTATTSPFERLMPKQYVEQLQAAQGRIAGERRVVTILFSDVEGSTAMAEHLDPEEVMEIMNGAFEVLIEPIYRYEGTLARLMGDAILAFFGAPIAHEDDPERACRAALDIISGAEEYAARLQRERGIGGFNVRVGINTGLVVVGEVGADLRVEYTAMGDAVNLAARMESAAEPGTILITEDTHKRVSHLFETEPLGHIHVKGKTEPVVAFRLLGLAASSLMRACGELYAPLVGRGAELARLQNTLRALREGQGAKLAISGEAGLGKTRLISETRQSLMPGIKWVEGHCLSYTEGMSYWIARQILYGLVGVKAESSPIEVGAALRSSIEQLSPDQVVEVYPYLARLLDTPLEATLEARLEHLGADELQRRMLQSFCEYIRAYALAQPLALVWEDLHWIDPSSLNMLEALLPLTEQVPLLLLLVFRPNEGRVFDLRQRLVKGCGDYPVIELTPLSPGDSAHLLDHFLKDKRVPEETRTLILGRVEGNPFFLEEVLHSLLDVGWVTAHGVQASIVQVPDTLQGVIMARIDRLPPQDKRVLQTAAVIGRVFQKSVLARVLNSGMAGDRLEVSLGELARREFISPHIEPRSVILSDAQQASDADGSSPPEHRTEPAKRLTDMTEALRSARSDRSAEEEYIFKHNMLLEVTYNSLLIAQRRELHRQVGEAVEAQFPDRLGELAATLAYHFEKAESQDKALAYLVRAASRASSVYAVQEAVAYYRRALALSGQAQLPPAHLAPVHEGLGDVHYLQGEYQPALEHYEQALQQVTDLRQRVALYRKMGQVCEKWGKYDCAAANFDAGLEEMREMMDVAEAARIYTGLGLVYYRQGKLDAALDLSTLALDLMERLGDDWGTAQACNNLGVVYGSRGEWAQAIEFLRRSLSIWENIGEVYGLAASHNNLGLAYCHHRDGAQAIEHCQQSLRLFERIGNRHGLARAYDTLSQAYMDQGDKEKAMECLTNAVTILTEIGMKKSQIIPEMWQSGAW